MGTILEVKHLSKLFGKKQKAALEMIKAGKSKSAIFKKTGVTVGVYDASFEVQEGEIFVIMGLSGSGKSTLVRMLNRLIEPSTGSILLEGKDISKMSVDQLREVRRHDMNMVFQSFALFPHKTILENTEFGLELRGVPKQERREIAKRALDQSGLLEVRDQYPDQLSGGMQQRVGLARALANSPKILLMDEAFSALDPLIRRDMQDELLELQETMKQTIIFISHDLNEALRIGDRIALMKDGQIMQIGTGEDILTNPANDFVREFVEDVDRSKVLTAQHIMIKPITTTVDLDGPQVALNRMHNEEVSMLMATNRRRQLIGSLTADGAIEARQKKLPLSEVIDRNVRTVSKDTVITDILPLIYDSSAPIAVTDEQHRLLGVIIRGRVLEALANIPDDDLN
ncbi:TPA: glycine betaine/L-proline ABC transporter ATP-binding protein [Streptococcus equi subsp. zooepidemicus]|uniref:Quaternary amine transport ATP-binding protein n=1 Tax=Streptococcus equi subsp. zooepidemicus (strain MGCS10565) TaxID=552526 RepID=B4U0B2_STREM|nr:glycine betaine/L-proline ABC transporter ATP-binding protein [Streptococcus equi]KIS14976.1 glycine betaine transport ATP-binding protein [Streptococcus equi subsp. zooepidemicus Sz105]ACG61555.1 glycine betaine transport ATP-binding protein OpuAA [Streptococcus equi subsp. zooepidemicus MGCS10565]MCD3389844.1 glycine betaine/L-proline ABC transporter ATP-binding protein [Streptococcus equi subsp. zooepidemicus]MDI5988454.1 glycine betaine/L-proline ABC transporter ATP-binding protein [Stre